MNTLSLDAAVALTGISRSTLWRRVTDGALAKGDKDARGRATLALADVLELLRDAGLADALGTDDLPVLLRADAGDAEAQADVGALLYLAGAERAALYWLNEAALQGSAEAMQWLGTAHAGRASAGGGATPLSESRMPTWRSCGSRGLRRWATPWRSSRWPACARAGCRAISGGALRGLPSVGAQGQVPAVARQEAVHAAGGVALLAPAHGAGDRGRAADAARRGRRVALPIGPAGWHRPARLRLPEHLGRRQHARAAARRQAVAASGASAWAPAMTPPPRQTSPSYSTAL